GAPRLELEFGLAERLMRGALFSVAGPDLALVKSQLDAAFRHAELKAPALEGGKKQRHQPLSHLIGLQVAAQPFMADQVQVGSVLLQRAFELAEGLQTAAQVLGHLGAATCAREGVVSACFLRD